MYDSGLIKQNIENIKKHTEGKAVLLAATKTVPAEVINIIYDMGVHVIGENRVNELMEKYDLLDKRFDIHFIGRLQRNKVKYIIGKVSLIHSLDSLSLAEEIEKQALKKNLIQDCLVEVNLGDEESKGGIPLDEVDEFLKNIGSFGHIRVKGLMGVLPKDGGTEQNRLFFNAISDKFNFLKGKEEASNIAMEILSLGMTADYVDAIECGSTMVRIGSGIFGYRQR